jgi:hypothetical protein
MSSEANQQEKKDPVTKQQVQNLSDLASFNAFCMVKLPKGGSVSTQLTYRHGMPEEAYIEDFQKWYRILSRLEADGGDEPYVEFWNGAKSTPASPAHVSQPDKPSNGNGSGGSGGSKRNYKDPIPQAELPAELVEVNENVYAADFDYILIKPDLDNKSVVEFWKDDLKFPVGAKMNKWKHDTIAGKLATLDLSEPVDPSKPAKIRVAGIQYWSKGGEYEYTKDGVTHKTNYKDLLLVKPIF